MASHGRIKPAACGRQGCSRAQLHSHGFRLHPMPPARVPGARGGGGRSGRRKAQRQCPHSSWLLPGSSTSPSVTRPRCCHRSLHSSSHSGRWKILARLLAHKTEEGPERSGSTAGSNAEHGTQAHGSTWHRGSGSGTRHGEGRAGLTAGAAGLCGKGSSLTGCNAPLAKGREGLSGLQSASSTAEEHPPPHSTFAKGSGARGRQGMQPRPPVLGKSPTPFP